MEKLTNPGLIIEQPLHIPATEIGSADGIRTHITLAENELSLLPLDDDATIKTGAISGQCSTGLPSWWESVILARPRSQIDKMPWFTVFSAFFELVGPIFVKSGLSADLKFDIWLSGFHLFGLVCFSI